MGRMSELHYETRTREGIMDKLNDIIGGNPIDELAPVMVVAVARMLAIDAGNDKDKLAFLVAKFMRYLTDTLNEMIVDEGIGEPRQ